MRLIYLGGPNGPVVYEIPVSDAQLDAMDRQLRALWATIDRAIDQDDFPPRPGPAVRLVLLPGHLPGLVGAGPR